MQKNVIEGTNAILGEIIAYYQKLYTTQNVSPAKIDEYLSEINIPKLKESDKNMLNEFPSYEECKDAVKI